jgi:hypothetical protein
VTQALKPAIARLKGSTLRTSQQDKRAATFF